MIKIPWELLPLIIVVVIWIIYGILSLFDEQAAWLYKITAAGITVIAFWIYVAMGIIFGISWLFGNVSIV